MKIEQIEIYQSPIKLKEPFVISLGPLEYAENVVVVIRTDKGIAGFGECSPFMTINGESLETCFVIGQYLAKALKGRNPLNIEECSHAMDAVIYGNASIKSAFDIALYDIASQNAGLPLYAFLGGKNNKTLVTDYTVSIGDPVKMAGDALKIKNNGFQVVKVKLGGSKEEDVKRIRLIREAIGTSLPLRIDANQGWDTETAISTLNALTPYNIQLCEEPIPRWNFMELPTVRKQSPIPIMADESCCDHHDAKRLVDLDACDFFNIKLGKSSGLLNAGKIIQIAEQTGKMVQVGGFLESRLAFTASAHFALTSDNIIHCDFDTPLMFVEDPVVGGITYDVKGVVTVPDKPGLGATMD
ncbi:MAG: dipeptide epimerase, partial [Bacteroidota bacterium]|nr:dipeptide epimerase [Bacteroidota bacterium]